MSRDAYILPDHKVVVFWSRKAANTSLARWLTPAIDPAAPLDDPLFAPRIFLKEKGLHVDHRQALALIREEGFDHYVLTRNPFTRAVSAFVEKFVWGNTGPRNIATVEPFAQKMYLDAMRLFGRSTDPADHAQSYHLSFDEFLAYLVHQVRNRADYLRGEPRLNAHWNTQVPYRFEHFAYENQIRVENVAADSVALGERLRLAVPFPHANFNQLREVMAPVVTAQAAELIREIYAIDFRKLGYDPDVVEQV